MLVRFRRRIAEFHITDSEEGVALVAVVVVMLVGFVIASTIAASVLFTIQANVSNKSTTQAFIAAESGRDQVVAQIQDGCADVGALDAASAAGTLPQFTAHAYTTTGARPTTSVGLSQTCPTIDTKYVLIESTGHGADGSATTIDSVYRWSATYSDVPGGVVTYFAGDVTQGVSHYTGDLVLRNGDWSCVENGELDGDLYVLSGTVSLSNNCVIKGDIWANGKVYSNSQSWHVMQNAGNSSAGDITTNGYVDFTANGSPAVDGYIAAGGQVKLSAAGGGTGTVGGTVTTQMTASIASAWKNVGPPLAPIVPIQGSTDPLMFTSVMTWPDAITWLLNASKWIDLDNGSGWQPAPAAGNCSKLKNSGTATPYIAGLLTSGTTPLVVDFTSCTAPTQKELDLDLNGTVVTRDLSIILGPSQTMKVNLSSVTSAADHQVMFVHSDANPDDVDADGAPKPTCALGSTNNDSFDTSGAAIPASLRIMVYSPCGLSGTVTAQFQGQLYTNDTTNFHAGSEYTCRDMEWADALPKLGCRIKGSGGVVDSTTIQQKLGQRVYQSEQ